MNRTDRMLAILLELQRKRVQRAEDLAEKFEVSKRSIYRDIDALAAAGVPVVAVPGIGYSLMEGYFLPPLSFTVDEATTLLVGGDVVAKSFDDEYRSVAATAIEKITDVLPPQLRTEVDNLIAGIRFVQVESRPRGETLEKVQTLRHAIVERRTVSFNYSAKGEGFAAPRRSTRCADPYALNHIDGHWYLSAYCHLRSEVRSFRLSRIEALVMTGDTFERPAHVQCAHDEQAFVIAEVLFDAESAQWVREANYYHKVSEEDCPEGLVVTLSARTVGDLVPWILSWGARACVLRPFSLAAAVRSAAEKIVERYVDEELLT